MKKINWSHILFDFFAVKVITTRCDYDLAMDDELLIEDVRKYPELYNLAHKHYMHTKKKEEIWRKIGNLLNSDGAACKTRWVNIRDIYRKSLKKEATKSGQGAKPLKPYKYHHQLGFLKPTMVERATISNISTDGAGCSAPESVGEQEPELERDAVRVEAKNPPNKKENEYHTMYQNLRSHQKC
ncbi:uncharacterized protein LOC131676008 [Topomyia yanbarensis]|uniref:uncharacterized protein LOC131676008 n=1 Tax=Topomyia yanbarensis TaxID=2498891 RepID=UPI00273CB569|nr:uncharacterized protein LOC131676008 [Topomyia yanbarensis]